MSFQDKTRGDSSHIPVEFGGGIVPRLTGETTTESRAKLGLKLRTSYGPTRKVLYDLHEAKRPLSTLEIEKLTQLGKFVVRDAIRVASELALLQKVPGRKYSLTPEGLDLAAAIVQDSPKEKFLLRRALLSNPNFVVLWRDIITHQLEVSQRSLAEQLAKRFAYTDSMAHTYANSALNFAKESGLLKRAATPHKYVPDPDASRELKGYVEQEVSLGIYPLVGDQKLIPDRDRPISLHQPVVQPESWRVGLDREATARKRSEAITEAYKLVARLGALLADKEQFESSAERTQVLTWIDSLPIFTGQGPDMEILRIAKEQAQTALRNKNAEALAFALRYLHVLARRHELTDQ